MTGDNRKLNFYRYVIINIWLYERRALSFLAHIYDYMSAVSEFFGSRSVWKAYEINTILLSFNNNSVTDVIWYNNIIAHSFIIYYNYTSGVIIDVSPPLEKKNGIDWGVKNIREHYEDNNIIIGYRIIFMNIIIT